MKNILRILFFLLLLTCPALADSATVRVAILPFDNALGHEFEDLAREMDSALIPCFTRHADKIAVVDRKDMTVITNEKTALFSSAAPQLLSATHLLRGTLMPDPAGISVTLMMYDLDNARLVASAVSSGAGDHIMKILCSAVDSLAKKDLAEKVPKNHSTATETKISVLMLQGIGLYYNGAFEKAIPVFMRLVKTAPLDPEALYWLGKSYNSAGMPDAARIEFQKLMDHFPQNPHHLEVELLIHPITKD